jgi:hypothetical protein
VRGDFNVHPFPAEGQMDFHAVLPGVVHLSTRYTIDL